MAKQLRKPKVSIIRATQPNYKAVADIIIKRSQAINIDEYENKKDIGN